MAYRFKAESRRARFMRRVSIDQHGCWLWDKVGVGGYGVSSLHGKHTLAHRVAYWLFRGEYQDGHDLDHLCRNRLCVNPEHLEPVTRSENLRRGVTSRGCIHGHSYADKDSYYVVNRSDGTKERRCKTCHRERNKRAKQAARVRGVAA